MMNRFLQWGSFTAAALAAVGCASPGPPRPPSLHLPAVVKSVRADRRGDTVVLRFTTPTRSTDNFALTSPVTARLCRAVAEAPCVFGGRRIVAGPVEWVDALPAEIASGPVRKLTYQVELLNSEGKGAGLSDAVVVAAGDTPQPVLALRASGSRGGVRLQWTAESPVTGAVILERKDLSGGLAAPVAKAGRKITVPVKSLPGRKGRAGGNAAGGIAAVTPSEDKDTVWLRAEAEPAGDPAVHTAAHTVAADSGGTIDAMALAGVPYRYTAVRLRVVTVGGVRTEMRSAASPPVEFTLRDVYPPGVPLRLAAAAFPVEGTDAVAVDLIWQPVSDADIAGYNVYRSTSSVTGKPMKLNVGPISLPSFHDTTATRGTRYTYTVTAVDSKSNESPPSDAADVETPPRQ